MRVGHDATVIAAKIGGATRDKGIRHAANQDGVAVDGSADPACSAAFDVTIAPSQFPLERPIEDGGEQCIEFGGGLGLEALQPVYFYLERF